MTVTICPECGFLGKTPKMCKSTQTNGPKMCDANT